MINTILKNLNYNCLKKSASQKEGLVSRLIKFCIACYVWIIIPTLTVIFASLVLLSAPLVIVIDSRRNFLHLLGSMWAKSIVLCNPWWTFKIEGKENLPPEDVPVVYVANHQSQADILSVFLLSRQFRWLAKDSLFKIPFLGWAMFAVGYVPVKRGQKRSHSECMRRSKNHLMNRTSMLFFPEGTRSPNGKLQTFKMGAFKLANESQVAIVPLTLQGASSLLPKGSITPSIATVTITIHPAIQPRGRSDAELMSIARAAIESTLLKTEAWR